MFFTVWLLAQLPTTFIASGGSKATVHAADWGGSGGGYGILTEGEIDPF